MKLYRNHNRDSGVLAYEYGVDRIRLRFAGGSEYEYAVSSVGAENLRAMKHLADSGDGLTTYINRHPEVKNGYV